MASSIPSLPSELVFDQILTRTSVESLGRCRLVSKDWNHITYDSRFWQCFCEKSNTVSGFLVQSRRTGKHFQTFVSVDNKANKNLTHSILNFLPVPVRIEAVSQGLVFCVNQNHNKIPDYFVCKPTTLQWEKLPNPKTRYSTLLTAMVVLSSKPLRYKIIRFSQPKSPIITYKSQRYEFRCEVFDSNTWAWKQLKNISIHGSVYLDGFKQGCIFVGGALYWLLANNQVFAFYEDKESWEIFDLPQQMRDNDHYNRLVEYQGRLALTSSEGELMDLWVMEDHEKKAWSKRHILSTKVLEEQGGDIITNSPLAFYNSDIAVMKGHQKVIFYKFQDSSCNVVTLGNHPGEVFKLQSNFERVNLRVRRWQDYSFIFFLFAFSLFCYVLRY